MPRARSSPRRRDAKGRACDADALPDFVPPCLATLVDAPPDGANWVHEIKYDGYRLQARIERGSVALLTRTGLDWTVRFPLLARALKTLKVETALIDGEAVVKERSGVTSFAKLVAALEAGRSGEIDYMAFDLLHLNGVDTTGAALGERKALLEMLLGTGGPSPRIHYSAHLATSGARVLKEACMLGLEGIVSKRADLPYRTGRGRDWLKSKCVQTDELVIGGFTASTVDPKAVGSLAVGYYAHGRLVYAGRVGTGFTRDTARAVWTLLHSLRQAASPFGLPLTSLQRRGVAWVRPHLVAQVAYRSWTGDGLLRHAAFKGLREDKPAKDVRKPAGAPA